MTYLEAANRAVRDDTTPAIDARAKAVIILGGGDTGADCLGTLHRQGAANVVQIEILDEPPLTRPSGEPWPTMARLLKTTSATRRAANASSRPRRSNSTARGASRRSSCATT